MQIRTIRRITLTLAAALAGCASPPTLLTAEAAQAMPVLDLCVGAITFGPRSSQAAKDELARRGVDCSDHKAAVAAKISADGQARAAALNSAGPVTCTTSGGATRQTTCY